MNEISSGVAFWILDAWRRMSAQLQLTAIKGTGEQTGSPATIWWTSPIDSKISVVIVDTAGQNKEWRLVLENCTFSFGVPIEAAPFPEFAEGKWLSYLSIVFSDATQLVFGERFIEPS